MLRPARARLRTLVVASLLGSQLGVLPSPRVATATDFNIDYVGTVKATCVGTFGGAALMFTGIAHPGSSGDYAYYIDIPELFTHTGAADCVNTWITWACRGSCTGGSFTGFTSSSPVHLGVTVDDTYATMSQGYVYNNSTTSTWDETKNLTDASGDTPCTVANTCDAPRTQAVHAVAAQGPGNYACLGVAPFGVAVHTDGKTLVVTSGGSDPPCPCDRPAYLGKVQFEYYDELQDLASLNGFTAREPFAVDTVAGGVMACGETLVVVNDAPPAGATHVVVTGIVDSLATADSPRGSQFWVQQVIIHEGEHLITATATAHGTIDPRGSVIVVEGGSQTFTITPDDGYRIADVVVDGVSVGAVTSYTFSSVTAEHRVDAIFAPLNSAPACSHAVAIPAQIWPPDHRWVPLILSGITDADGDLVSVRVTGVTQDESAGPGDHCLSAMVDANGSCQLRAERSAKGNGRVYRVSYTASDGKGGSCDGSLLVAVPHDQGHRSAVDDGQTVNAMGPCSADKHDAARKSRTLEVSSTSFAGTTATVEYSTPAPGRVSIALFDIAGRRVADVVTGSVAEGQHTVTWSTAGLARGVYFYRLQSGSTIVTRTLLLVR
jgi:hypothetical protein